MFRVDYMPVASAVEGLGQKGSTTVLKGATLAGVKHVAALFLVAMHPDLLLINGKIWTVNPAQPEAQAVACRDGKIVAVGTTAEIRSMAGPETKVVDLRGRRVVPGFNDAHVHFYSGGSNLTSVQLRDCKSQAEFRERIRQFAAKLPPGRWITGGLWDHESWTPAELPTREVIDDVTGDHPVFVQRLDGQWAWQTRLRCHWRASAA